MMMIELSDDNQLNAKPSYMEVVDLFHVGMTRLSSEPSFSRTIAERLLAKLDLRKYEESLVETLTTETAFGLVLLAAIESQSSQYKIAFNYLVKAKEIGQYKSDHYLLSCVLHTLGNCYAKIGDLEKALDAYLLGLRSTRLNDCTYEVNLLNNISVIYSKMGQFEQSLLRLKEVHALIADPKSSFSGFVLSNIAEVYYKLNDLALTKTFNDRAWEVLKGYDNDSVYHIQCFKVYAKLYGSLGDVEGAINCFKKAKAICEKIKDTYRLCTVLMEWGKFYSHKNQFNNALDLFLEAFNVSVKTYAEVEQRDLAKLLSQTYEFINRDKEALKYLKIHFELHEKIKTRTLDIELHNQTLNYDMEKAKQLANLKKLEADMMRESLRDIHLIGEIGQLLTSTLDFDDVLTLIYENTLRLVKADVIGICLYNEDEGVIDYRLLVHDGENMPLRCVAIDDPISYAAKCIRERELVYERQLENQPMRSVIYTPLIVADEVVGAFTLQSVNENMFTQKVIELLLALSSYVAIALKNSMQSELLAEKSKELQVLSQTDSLTNLYNRRYMLTRLEEELDRTIRNRGSFTLALIDIDHFKMINDEYGHMAGDKVLIAISELLNHSTRPYDVLARWGGEEFLLLLPQTNPDEALLICERIRVAIAQDVYAFNGGRISLSVTIGISGYKRGKGLDDIIHNADKALYLGKENGRNRTESFY